MKLMRKRNRGFTLIELLIVIAVLAGIVTMVTVRLIGPETTARDTRRKSDIRAYQSALEIYANANDGIYPDMTGDADKLCDAPVNLADNCAVDPNVSGSGEAYQYVSDAVGSEYVLSAKLEKVAEYFVACSNAQVGNVESLSGSNCPL